MTCTTPSVTSLSSMVQVLGILLVLIHCMAGCWGTNMSEIVRTEREDRGYQTFPCQCGGRSYDRPHQVGEVTLQDIDIIGAIGDSDTAAFAANSRGLDYLTEYWGISFATGESHTRV